MNKQEREKEKIYKGKRGMGVNQPIVIHHPEDCPGLIGPVYRHKSMAGDVETRCAINGHIYDLLRAKSNYSSLSFVPFNMLW